MIHSFHLTLTFHTIKPSENLLFSREYHVFSWYLQYGSEKNAGITVEKFGSYFASIINKKMGLNTLQDTKKKQPQLPVKDNFWPVR